MPKKTIWIITSILLIYFTFTSGLMFEITKSKATDRIDIPYSIGLSTERTGITTLATQDDIACLEWLNDNWDGKTDIVGDYNTYMLITANVPAYFSLHNNLRYGSLYELPNSCYIFISRWNTKHGQYIEATGIGLRTAYPMPKLDYPIVYQSGKTIIYKKELPK